MEKTVVLQGLVTIQINTRERAGLERGDPGNGYTECYIIINGITIHRHTEVGNAHKKDAACWVRNTARELNKVSTK